jgi:hypothetical protein
MSNVALMVTVIGTVALALVVDVGVLLGWLRKTVRRAGGAR